MREISPSIRKAVHNIVGPSTAEDERAKNGEHAGLMRAAFKGEAAVLAADAHAKEAIGDLREQLLGDHRFEVTVPIKADGDGGVDAIAGAGSERLEHVQGN